MYPVVAGCGGGCCGAASGGDGWASEESTVTQASAAMMTMHLVLVIVCSPAIDLRSASWTRRDVACGSPPYTGIIVYDPSGWMSVQIAGQRPPLEGETPFDRVSPEQR